MCSKAHKKLFLKLVRSNEQNNKQMIHLFAHCSPLGIDNTDWGYRYFGAKFMNESEMLEIVD